MMRILYVDIDSLRPDHLGCYGYHRNTSPNMDAVAAQAVRFENCYISDAPCLPSRTALWSGRFGYKTGVVGHGGTTADPFIEGPGRGFRDVFDATGWMRALRNAGIKTATVSSFGERHAAWHWYAGFNEIYNPGLGGLDLAEDVTPIAIDWLRRKGSADKWFLHVNYWDPHTPYRTPREFGNPFKSDPVALWLSDELRARLWEGYGPHSAQEPLGYGHEDDHRRYPRVPQHLDSMEAVKQWIDGYDVGIRYVDEHVGHLLNTLADLRILDETIVMISADHGENQGEFNVWGDHQTADEITCRVPLIIRWPGKTDQPRLDQALHYHFDWAATLIELLGGQVPESWDGRSFAPAFQSDREQGRDYLVTSQNAWACQRGVRFRVQPPSSTPTDEGTLEVRNYLCLRTYHDGLKQLDPVMLFDLDLDPHEQYNLAESDPQLVDQAMRYLVDWEQEMKLVSRNDTDPMMTVLREGGPFHTRGELPTYLQRLEATGRFHHARSLMMKHPSEARDTSKQAKIIVVAKSD